MVCPECNPGGQQVLSGKSSSDLEYTAGNSSARVGTPNMNTAPASDRATDCNLPRVLHMDEGFNAGTYNVIRAITSQTIDRFKYAVLYGHRCQESATAMLSD